jgi:hypothetical protein
LCRLSVHFCFRFRPLANERWKLLEPKAEVFLGACGAKRFMPMKAASAAVIVTLSNRRVRRILR